MEYVTITRYGANLIVPAWCVQDLPDEKTLPIDKVPTFCGAGSGIGDALVRDTLCGVRVAICCYFHDVEWSGAETLPDDILPEDHWMDSNYRLYKNLVSLMRTHSRNASRRKIVVAARTYFEAVSSDIGWMNYEDSVSFPGIDPRQHPVYIEKNQRLWRPVHQ